MAPEAGTRRRRLALSWALVVPLLLGVAWNHLAGGFASEGGGLLRHGDVFGHAGVDLSRTRAELPAPTAARIAILGSSQMATVKGGGTALPTKLQQILASAGQPTEIVDFSTGRQQIVESMVIWFSVAESTRPSILVMGVSLFNMLSLDVRETLAEDLDTELLRHQVERQLPADTSRKSAADLLSFTRTAAQRVASRGETTQQRLDSIAGEWLSRHFAFVANRQVIFDELIDRPVRRDLRSWIMRSLQAARTARTYEPNSAYAVSVLALECMQGLSKQLGIRMLVILLPFDASRPPVPFLPETMERIRSDLTRAGERSGFGLIDQSGLLETSFFGDFQDGSPDNLHFSAQGHARLARAIAAELTALLPESASGADPARGD